MKYGDMVDNDVKLCNMVSKFNMMGWMKGLTSRLSFVMTNY